MAENVGKRGKVWFFRLDLPPGPDGTRRQMRRSGFATERAAKQALAEAKVSVDRGQLRAATSMTVGELLNEWLDVIEPNRKPSTMANYRMLVNAYLLPTIGKRPLSRLGPGDIQRLYAGLRKSAGVRRKPLSGRMVHNVHQVLHTGLEYGIRLGYLAQNPAGRVEKPRSDSPERSVYTPEQIQEFLAAADAHRLRALWWLVITTGLRRAELCGLRWGDVALDRERPSLVVRHARTTAGHRPVEHGPKTKAGRRVVLLDRDTAAILAEHRDAMRAEAEVIGRPGLSDYVFVNELGEPYHPVRLNIMLHRLQREVRLPEITLHDLRHTSATIALLAGVHPKVVAERHGHSSTQITLDRYSHVIASMQESAAVAIGSFLRPQTP